MRSLLAKNTLGTLPPDISVFLAKGTADEIVRPAVTRDYEERLCRAGSRVTGCCRAWVTAPLRVTARPLPSAA